MEQSYVKIEFTRLFTSKRKWNSSLTEEFFQLINSNMFHSVIQINFVFFFHAFEADK